MRNRNRNRSTASQLGIAAVDLATLLPRLAAALVGGVDWRAYFFVAQVAHNAARAGARAGTLHRDGRQTMADAWAAVTECIARAGLDASQATIAVSLTPRRARVEVSLPIAGLTRLGTVPMAASATAESRRLR